MHMARIRCTIAYLTAAYLAIFILAVLHMAHIRCTIVYLTVAYLAIFSLAVLHIQAVGSCGRRN